MCFRSGAYTVGYKLSDLEAQLYKEVTEYVREEFNRADNLDETRRGTVGFALTILERRLASSPEAIYQSLRRRKERLEARLREERLMKRGEELSAKLDEMEDVNNIDDLPEAEADSAEGQVVDCSSIDQRLLVIQLLRRSKEWRAGPVNHVAFRHRFFVQILIDDSSNSTLGSQFGDLRQFIERQPVTTSIAIGYMRNATVETVQPFTTDRPHAAGGPRLPFSYAGGTASPYLSLSDAIKHWHATSARREVVMVTSGIDSYRGMGLVNPYLDVAIEDAQRNGIVVYAIYMPSAGHSGHSSFRMNWAQNYLAQLSEETGGEAYMLGFGPPVAFAPYLEEIGTHLQHQYSQTLLMKPEGNGGLRQVRFSTEVPNAEIVAPAKVYVAH